jgi:polysaccharide deacetylase family protein (PEP-CTERM system associated)
MSNDKNPVNAPSDVKVSPLLNAMSVDVEDYYQVGAFEKIISKDDWDGMPSRVVQNTEKILDIFAAHHVKATFFTLAWVATRHPALIRRIVAEGHELASHGMCHVRAFLQNEQEFRADVRQSKAILEDISGAQVKGYRAASFSIGAENLWALDVLQQENYAYSSSVYPIAHDHYGMKEGVRFPYKPVKNSNFIEVPLTTVEFLGRRIPCSGGGYFRLLPYALSRWAISRVNKLDGYPCMFYFHPWEVDPDQPRQQGAGLKSRFRHYTNLSIMEAKLQAALRDFRWGRADEVYLDPAQPWNALPQTIKER